MPSPRKATVSIRTINLEEGKPPVREALARLERELTLARRQGCTALKFIHGYGSSGAGGDIRIAMQKRLRELYDDGQTRACIFGENWATSDTQTWALLNAHPAMKSDPDLGKRNLGITIVVL
jgi:hypothetical protein